MIEEWLMLAELLSHPGLEGRAIAWRCGHLVDRSVFLADVLAWFAAFKPCPGPRVALYFDEGYEFACALFGAWHAGKQVVLPGDTQPATLARLLPQVDACAGRLPGALQPAARQVAGGEPLPASLPAIDASRAGVVVHTSGSSGEPLALDKSLSQLDTELRALQAAFGALVDAQGPAAVHATVSHQHIYGLLFGVLWPLAAGRPFVAERVVYPEDMAARLGPRPSILVTSPAHLTRLPLQLDWQAARTGLQAVFSSGGPLPLAALLAARSLLGRTPIEVYGSSETGGVAWRQQAGQGDANAAWTPLPGVECRVDLDLDGSGLLDVRSGHLPDASAWFRTADRVRPAEAPDSSAERAAVAPGGEGSALVALSRFVLLGRADRVVKIEEKRVSITALERLLSAADELAEGRIVVLDAATRPRLAVVGVPSDAGQALLLAQGKRALNERLRAWLLQGVERVALPRRFRYVARLPVNEQGKTLDARLAALFRPSQPAIEWVSREPSSAVARLDMSPDLLVFDGHFPEAPILPGVAQLDWAIRIGQSCFGEGGELQHFVRAEALKFQRPVLPGMCVELTLTWRVADRVLAFAYRSESGLHASGSLVFAVPLPQEVADA